jgi:hypothetical protein
MTSPYRDPLRDEDLQREELDESDEEFDRLAFARRAIELVDPSRTRVVLCQGARAVQLDVGRAWGRKPPGRWAVLWVPRRASRRAIALAALELAEGTSSPYALDTLIQHAWHA